MQLLLSLLCIRKNSEDESQLQLLTQDNIARVNDNQHSADLVTLQTQFSLFYPAVGFKIELKAFIHHNNL